MDKKNRKFRAIRNSKTGYDFNQDFREDSMSIDSDSQDSTISGDQKDRWTEMKQTIHEALRNHKNDTNYVEITEFDNNNNMISDNIIIEDRIDKRVPTQLTDEAIHKLDEEFYRHDLAIKQIAQNHNIDVSLVQKYMNDHNENVKIGLKHKKSGYTVFHAREWCPNASSAGTESNTNKACTNTWRSISKSNKQKYEERTILENEKSKESQFDYIEDTRKRHIQAQSDINNIRTTVCCMGKRCGLEVVMLVVPSRSDDSFTSTFIGTSNGEAFFNASPEMYPLLDKFEIYAKNRYLEETGQITTIPIKRIKTSKYDASPHNPIAVSSTHRNINSADVKARVRAILRARYNDALGTEGLIIPYKKWKDHQDEIEIIGWPDDVPFDDFGVLKVAQKKQILDSLNNIFFRKKEDKIVL